MPRTLRDRLILLVIFLAGAALRLFRLGSDSLWYDETVSTTLAGSPLPELIRHTAGDIHPPGYYAMLRGWLLLTGYPAGRADPAAHGLEFAAGFFSLFFGVLLVALVYTLARRAGGRAVALIAALLAALSPYNVWYSQEVRMYTLGAALGAVTVYALWRTADHHTWSTHAASSPSTSHRSQPRLWWGVYAIAAAAGMYTLYYFTFLLLPLNLWVLWRMVKPGAPHIARLQPPAANLRAWLLANLAAALLYAPWIPVAWRQATEPPVPPWRTAPDILAALRESWTALSLGQSAPAWLWPVLLLTLGLYGVGVFVRRQITDGAWQAASRPAAIRRQPSMNSYLPLATFAPLALILLVSLATPLYHVRYLFTYSPAFYVVLAAGLAWLRQRSKVACIAAGLAWLAAAGVTLGAYWAAPSYRADDHRAAVQFLQEQWRPGDAVLVNAGWPYTALATYWGGPIAGRTRLADDLPAPRADAALVIITTGHLDGDPNLGWADPRSDFFALPADVAQRQLSSLFRSFNRIWHYRIYDTVNDPEGRIRDWLAADGQIFEDQAFSGEANMRVQGFLPRAAKAAEPTWPSATFAPGLTVRSGPLMNQLASGETLYPLLAWQPTSVLADCATSVRLAGPDGATWAQGPDERLGGRLFSASRWTAGDTVWQTAALPVPPGTPPGRYTVELVLYDPASGQPWPAHGGELAPTPNGVRLGEVRVFPPSPEPASRPALARFGPLALVEATSPATTVAPAAQIPIELLWQAVEPPGEPLVVVVQLLGAGGWLAANLEAQPVDGLHPTQMWAAGELVRDRHLLELPPDMPTGKYRLVLGVYRAADRERLKTQAGLFGKRDYWVVKTLEIK